jgi:hypothetical protein|tara:strand:- start:1645 stop:1965 length:321 start_codon:yes stop_codon:yes gene_type:complete
VEKINTIDISGLSLQDFKDFLGIPPMSIYGEDDILSDEGLRLLNDSYISTSMAITVFGQSPVLQNISPEYNFARGLVYDLFMTNLSLYTELLTLIRNNSPLKHEIN